MAATFSADEIFEMAEEIERNGAKYYRKAAELVKDKGHKKLLQTLAEMEDQHEVTFGTLRSQLQSATYAASVFDPEGQSSLYLQAMASGHVFDIRANPCDTLNDQSSMEDILKFAIECEKNSIIFYLGLKDVVPGEPEKLKVEYIINEERDHITQLSGQLAELM
jgi:rubrerythrin